MDVFDMKQAYELFYKSSGYPEPREIVVLPKCNRVRKYGVPTEYQLVRRKVFFGLIPLTYWLNKHNIEWYNAPTVEYYDCNCGEE